MPATFEKNNRTARYQEGSLERVARAKGPDVWVYRWRELDGEDRRIQKKQVIGDVHRLPNRSAAKREVENLRAAVNAKEDQVGKMTVGLAWGHFQLHELHDAEVGRSATTIDRYLQTFKSNILPTWKNVALDDVKAVKVEKWLRSLDLANGTKAKIRNTMSVLFSHCIRHELYDKLNPIASVRQSSIRVKDPDILSLDEIGAIISNIKSEAVRVMVSVAATTALRRSEICGLRWSDVNFENRWLDLKRGVVHKATTKLKTKASRRGVPMSDGLADVLSHWRTQTPYPANEDWVFGSPYFDGKRPYSPVPAMSYHVQPAALAAGIRKHVGWHTFRHSVGSLLGQSGENIKVVQEILRHANSRITQDVYQQADQAAKRTALEKFSGLFVVPEKNAV